MIIRILSVQLADDTGPEFHAFIREQGLPRIQLHPGLVSVNIGRRTADEGEEAVVVTVWRDWASLEDALGPDTSQPYLITPAMGLMTGARVQHFEAIDLPALQPLEISGAESPSDSDRPQPDPIIS
jgi:hypothetical protein